MGHCKRALYALEPISLRGSTWLLIQSTTHATLIIGFKGQQIFVSSDPVLYRCLSWLLRTPRDAARAIGGVRGNQSAAARALRLPSNMHAIPASWAVLSLLRWVAAQLPTGLTPLNVDGHRLRSSQVTFTTRGICELA